MVGEDFFFFFQHNFTEFIVISLLFPPMPVVVKSDFGLPAGKKATSPHNPVGKVYNAPKQPLNLGTPNPEKCFPMGPARGMGPWERC